MVAPPSRIVLASANPKKVAELQDLLGTTGIVVVPRPSDLPEVVEDADDFVGNARLKAVSVAAATGSWALADDSGLEVDALGGAPGVRSARYAGDDATDEENVDLLLNSLIRLGADRPEQRRARFRCWIVARAPDGTELVTDGTVQGSIAHERRGSSGFGYDPVFVPDEGDGRTFAEMTSDEKHQLSHRGRALRSLSSLLGED